MPQLIVVIIVIAIIIAVLNVAIPFCGLSLLFCAENTLAVADRLLGSWAGMPPWISWFVVASVCTVLLHFAVFEASKLSRPFVAPLMILASCMLLVATPIVGPSIYTLYTLVPVGLIDRVGHWFTTIAHGAPKNASDCTGASLPCGVYVVDSASLSTDQHIGGCIEVLPHGNAISETGLSGHYTVKRSSLLFVFRYPVCFNQVNQAITQQYTDTMRCKLVINGFVCGKRNWSFWAGGNSRFNYAEANFRWVSLRAGQNIFGFALDSQGTLKFNRTPLSHRINGEEMAKISPLSPSSRYRIAVKWDPNHAGGDVHIVDVNDSRVIIKWLSQSYGILESIYLWSPDERFLLMERGGEGVCNVICFDLHMQTVREVPFRNLAVTYRGSIPEIQLNSLDSASWINNGTFKIQISIYCNWYDDTSCPGAINARRTCWAYVDASSLAIRYDDPVHYINKISDSQINNSENVIGKGLLSGELTLYKDIATEEIRNGNIVTPVGYPTGNAITYSAKEDTVEVLAVIPNNSESSYTFKIRMANGTIWYKTGSIKACTYYGDKGAILSAFLSKPNEYEGDINLVDEDVVKFRQFIENHPHSIFLPEALLELFSLQCYTLQGAENKTPNKLERVKQMLSVSDTLSKTYNNKTLKELYDIIDKNQEAFSNSGINTDMYNDIRRLVGKIKKDIPSCFNQNIPNTTDELASQSRADSAFTAESKSEWVKLKCFQIKYGLQLIKDENDTTQAYLEYEGNRLGYLRPILLKEDTVNIISSPSAHFLYVWVWDTDGGGRGATQDAILIDTKKKCVLASLGHPNTYLVIQDKIFWTSDESYAAIPDRGPVQMQVAIVALEKPNSYRDVKVSDNSMCYVSYFDFESFSWASSRKLTFNTVVHFNTCWDNCSRNEDVEGHFKTFIDIETGNKLRVRISPLSTKEINEEMNCD